MTASEFQAFVTAMRAFYPKEHLLPTEEIVTLWYTELADIPYEIAVTALKTHVATNEWSPSIAHIRRAAVHVVQKDLDAGKSFELALDAVHRFGYLRQAEAIEYLRTRDALTAEAVSRMGYRAICDTPSDTIGVTRGQYIKIYNDLVKRRADACAMSAELRAMIAKARQDNLQIGQKHANAIEMVG